MIKISHGTQFEKMSNVNGYGYATEGMLASLSRLGYEVNQNDPTADVEIWFDQPHHWKFSKGVYKIGYHPWESTQLREGWADVMNECDEIWTPSPLIADWYRRYAGITRPIYVYEHGVDKVWTPKKRQVEDKVKFLHVGLEALRKGGEDVMRAFRTAFEYDAPVEMNMKLISEGWNIPKIGRANIINRTLSLKDLIGLYHNTHVFVYPSWGEGFGLNPLQALSTGMPTITVPAWAPYSEFLDPRLSVSATLSRTPWEHRDVHPGLMFKPNFDELVDRMRYAAENFETLHLEHLAQVDALQARYDWDTLTKNTFDALCHRLQK